MKRQIFYSMWRKDGITGVKECDGFVFLVDGMKFNAYKGKDEIIHIIDPMTGMSILQYDYLSEMDDMDDTPSELEMVKAARKRLERECEKITILEKKRDTESYRLMSRIFRTYQKGAKLEKRMQEELEKEQEEVAGQ